MEREGCGRISRALVALAASLTGACGADLQERPDVLLVTIDTLRADHCSSYGHPLETTPGLDRIASEGVLFETVYAPVGATCPSHATLFTAKHPIAHGVVRNGLELGREQPTLAELMAAQGWSTAAFVSSFPVTARFGFDQGFEHFDAHFQDTPDTIRHPTWTGVEVEAGFDRPARATLERALTYMEREDPAEPLFLWVHLFDPHAPWSAPDEWRQRFLHTSDSAGYDAEVAFADSALEALVRSFRARAPERGALLVVTADHGEGLGDHGFAQHNATMYEEELRVPLVLQWSGHLPAGLRVDQPAHLVDIVPTLAALLDLDLGPWPVEGVDLTPFVRTAERAPERPVFFQRPTYGEPRPRFGQVGPAYGVRRGAWKLLVAPEEGTVELYDLERDPRERDNLAAQQPELARELEQLLDGWLAEQALRAPAHAARGVANAAEGLRALGYADGLPEEGE